MTTASIANGSSSWVLEHQWFHLDGCGKTEYRDKFPSGRFRQCREHKSPASSPRAGRRDHRGIYPATELGALAIDGNVLDRIDQRIRPFAYSSEWVRPKDGQTQADVLSGSAKGCCFYPQYRSFGVGVAALGCKDHQSEPTPPCPWPMSPEEQFAAEQRHWLPIAEKIHVPKRLRVARLDSPTVTPALKRVREFDAELDDALDTDEGGLCLILLGGPGVGKSYAAAAWFRSLALFGTEPDELRFYPVGALVTALLGEHKHSVLRRLKTVEHLILDDFGATYLRPGSFAGNLLEEALIDREHAMLATVITSNHDWPEFSKLVGPRITDRLRGSWGRIFKSAGRSLRRRDKTTEAEPCAAAISG